MIHVADIDIGGKKYYHQANCFFLFLLVTISVSKGNRMVLESTEIGKTTLSLRMTGQNSVG